MGSVLNAVLGCTLASLHQQRIRFNSDAVVSAMRTFADDKEDICVTVAIEARNALARTPDVAKDGLSFCPKLGFHQG